MVQGLLSLQDNTEKVQIPFTQVSAVHGKLSLHCMGVCKHIPSPVESTVHALLSSQFGKLHDLNITSESESVLPPSTFQN
jgi:hypothetical protein